MQWLYRFLGSMLSVFESITGGYALALLLYALVFKIVFLPFSIKQQKNQIALAKLTPKIELIKAKYKGRTDQPTMQKQQQEIQELQQKEGYSPLSGCLPLLIQLPLIMLLYTVIYSPLSYIAKPTEAINNYNDHYSEVTYEISEDLTNKFGVSNDNRVEIEMSDIIIAVNNEINNFPGYESEDITELKKGTEIGIVNNINKFINDDSITLEGYNTKEKRINAIESYGLKVDTIPNFNFLGVNLAETPSLKNFSILCLIPVLAAAAQWVSMWLTRKFNNTGLQGAQDQQTQASMKIMDLLFPLMTLWMAFSFSGMLGLYWIFQSGLGLLQSFILSKAMPLPKYTEEELKEMRKAQKEAEKNQRNAAKGQPKYRSLHYIDDDDYDILPDAPTNNEDGKNDNKISSDLPEIKD